MTSPRGLAATTEVAALLHAVTSAELLRVNRIYLRPDRRVIVIVGDARSVGAQLAGIARFVK